jgi:N-acetylmuramoyl-L-alanine amidase
MSFFKWLKDFFIAVEVEASKKDTPVLNSEAKPVEAKPVEAKPVEAKPVEAKPVEATKKVNPVLPKAPDFPIKKAEASKADPVTLKPAKIAIIVGHTTKEPGAVNYKKESEFSFNSRIAKKVETIMKKKYPKKQVQLFIRTAGDFSATVLQVAKKVGAFKADISLELHFNAVKQVAYGCEVLIWEAGNNFEKTLSKLIKVKPRDKKDNK